MAQNNNISIEGSTCPLPLQHNDIIVMGHGSGGRMTQELIQQFFIPHFANEFLLQGNDAAKVTLPGIANLKGHLSLSTDSHIVNPLFFPGGDIGRLAVCGTVNDVSMLGAIPLYLTAGFILEEGFPTETLERVLVSMQQAAHEAGVQIVSGDTKVVEKGKADGLFINTAGLGWIPSGRLIGGANAQPGDIVLLSGNIGDHGVAVLSARGELGLQTEVRSDIAPLNSMIQAVLVVAPHVHVLRDPTRGGLATTLNEIAVQSQVSVWLEEKNIPIQPAVRAVSEMLGLDPLYIANEGKVIVILPSQEADAALAVMRASPYGLNATRIGEVKDSPVGRLLLKTSFGSTRILDVLTGEMLPRIC